MKIKIRKAKFSPSQLNDTSCKVADKKDGLTIMSGKGILIFVSIISQL
jgi:hypothetical protein